MERGKIYQESFGFVPGKPLVDFLHGCFHQYYVVLCAVAQYLLDHIEVPDLEGGGTIDDLRYFLDQLSALYFGFVVDDHGLAATLGLSYCLQRVLHLLVYCHFCISAQLPLRALIST